uniref:Saposin B-type domain-containing protein n=1 Tax=Steinernema glaseri TaxID=37863 RepID=A0A1I7ZVS6_9BILA
MKVAIVLAATLALAACAAIDLDAKVPKAKDNYGIKKVQKPLHTKVTVEDESDGLICSICTQTITKAKETIIDHEDDAAHVIEQVCDSLFKKESTEDAVCKSIIEQELPQIVELLKKKVDSEEICKDLYLC